MRKFYDVSLMITEDMIVYPGNPQPSIKKYSSIPENSVNESVITMGSHTGTHVDSKLHIQKGAEGASALFLDSFFGTCKVLDLTHIEKEIHRKDLISYNVKKGDILIFKTKNSLNRHLNFHQVFVHVKLDAAKYIVGSGVKTLGFDYLSVKKFGADPEVHTLLINNLTLFEGLNLENISAGEYTFLGLPLRINCDGAPARVILVKE